MCDREISVEPVSVGARRAADTFASLSPLEVARSDFCESASHERSVFGRCAVLDQGSAKRLEVALEDRYFAPQQPREHLRELSCCEGVLRSQFVGLALMAILCQRLQGDRGNVDRIDNGHRTSAAPSIKRPRFNTDDHTKGV